MIFPAKLRTSPLVTAPLFHAQRRDPFSVRLRTLPLTCMIVEVPAVRAVRPFIRMSVTTPPPGFSIRTGTSPLGMVPPEAQAFDNSTNPTTDEGEPVVIQKSWMLLPPNVPLLSPSTPLNWPLKFCPTRLLLTPGD